MVSTFSNSPMKSGSRGARIETGVVANVNVRSLTIDWVSQYNGRQITDVQIMTPYLHFNNGEGFTCVPEVGAICVLCWPTDDDPPFVMGFLSAPELEGADFSKFINEKLLEPGVESEEDMDKQNTISSGGSTAPSDNPSDVSFRAGRPILNPGDMFWQGRDENFVVLRRGGVLQLGSTNICQRAYIPILNYIRDFCENYELNTAAGSLSWTVKRQENDPSGNAPTEYELIAREYAQDKKASVKVLLGSLDDAAKPPGGDKTFVEVTIAPQQIDPTTGELSGKDKFVFRLDKAGNMFVHQAGDRTEVIDGDVDVTIKGNESRLINGNQDEEISGNQTVTLGKNHDLSGVQSTEDWSGNKVIGAAQVLLGSQSASEPAVLGLKLVQWLLQHTHAVAAAPNPAPGVTIPTLPVMGDPSTVPMGLKLQNTALSKVVKLK